MNLASCSSCDKASENKFFNCPPKMSDGRHFTDYRPRCAVNYPTEFKDAPLSSYDYRQYLIQNAEKLMTANYEKAFKDNACGPCVEPWNQGTMLPEQTMQECNGSTCKFSVNDPNGLGLGRMYGESKEQEKARASFVANREALNKEMMGSVNCCSTESDDVNKYSVSAFDVNPYEGRFAVPGGGVPLSGTSRF